MGGGVRSNMMRASHHTALPTDARVSAQSTVETNGLTPTEGTATMPQYGMIVYSPVPADPNAYSPEYLAAIDDYPAKAKSLGGKVLGGSYFSKERGFALDPSTAAMTAQGDEVRSGTMLESGLAVSAFYVVAAPDIDVAVQIARLHPATRDGGVEVRPLFVPAGQVQDDYAD
jgi:hypothetical protein